MLRGFKHHLEMISKDASANVVLLRSCVPKVFCSGVDLKERRSMDASEVHSFVHSLRSTFSFLEMSSLMQQFQKRKRMRTSRDNMLCNSVKGLPEFKCYAASHVISTHPD